MPDFNTLSEKWSGQANVIVVYMREAHASDEWPMGNHVNTLQATSLEERAVTARQFVEATGLTVPVFLDGIADPFMHAFSAHPQRFFIINGDGTLIFKAVPSEGEYEFIDVEHCLEKTISGFK